LEDEMMRIATIGRGKIGGGLGDLWEKARHEVTRLGHEGGDVSAVEVVLVAVPGDSIKAALEGVTGLAGKTAIDATNLYGGATPPDGHASNAEYVKSVTGGPTAKAWNVNFGALYHQVAARPLANAGKQEAMLDIVFAIAKEGGMGQYFYRFAPPAQF
jgi:predicted dinucleotide-binding enzyme